MRSALMVIAALVVSFGALLQVNEQPKTANKAKWPTFFAPDNENKGFENAVSPSDAVLEALLSTEEAKSADEDFASLDREGKRKCFTVVRIDLASEKDEDYIASGDCHGLMGANIIYFWVIHVDQGKAKVLLTTGGLTVRILRSKTNGFRDIEEEWGGNRGWDRRIYKYTGATYKLVKDEWHDAKQ